MQSPRDTRVHDLFFVALALASSACDPYRSAPPDPPRTTPPPVDTAPITDPAAIELAKEFHSADPGKAIAGAELLGYVETKDEKPTCSMSPCPAEWTKLAEHGGRFVAILRRGSALEKVTIYNFKEVVGAVDTPEKAALRMRLEEWHPATTCARFARQNLHCAEGSVDDHIPVRKGDAGFEVATFSSRNVCEANRFGEAFALGVSSVSPSGDLGEVNDAISKAAAANVVAKAECRSPSLGRMFEGFVHATPAASELQYYLRAQREETAAIAAFLRLASELELHGAPRDLARDARRSAAQERRHAALFQREAERVATALGVTPDEPEPAPMFEPRSLAAMLRENAEEGCANETYAAIVATHQADHAPTERLRALFRSIARDERAHAALAHRIHAWGQTQLEREDARALRACHREACERMARSGATPLGPSMGEPPSDVAAAAFRRVVRTLTPC